MTQEFFTRGASVEVLLLDTPMGEDDEDFVLHGFVVERDATGLPLESAGIEEYGYVYIPWTNIAQVMAVEFGVDEESTGNGELLS